MPREVLVNDVRAQRLRRDLTQDDLAARVGVTRQTIISLEKGDYVPSTILALKLSVAVATPVERLFRIETRDD